MLFILSKLAFKERLSVYADSFATDKQLSVTNFFVWEARSTGIYRWGNEMD
jgi:hypothetical protein